MSVCRYVGMLVGMLAVLLVGRQVGWWVGRLTPFACHLLTCVLFVVGNRLSCDFMSIFAEALRWCRNWFGCSLIHVSILFLHALEMHTRDVRGGRSMLKVAVNVAHHVSCKAECASSTLTALSHQPYHFRCAPFCLRLSQWKI